MNIAIWAGATIAMFVLGVGWLPFALGLAVGLALARFKHAAHRRKLVSLVAEYQNTYGESPPGFDPSGTEVGGAIGAAAGHHGAGGLLGAMFDGARHLWRQRGMTPEQKSLHLRIVGLQAWSPWRSAFILVLWLGMSWGASWANRLLTSL